MRHRKRTKILSRQPAARKALLRDMATSLVLYGKLRTTAAKARVLRPLVERMVTIARRNSLAGRRQLIRQLRTQKAVQRIMDDIAPAMKGRRGGYTRMVKLGHRHGDGADVVLVEFVR